MAAVCPFTESKTTVELLPPWTLMVVFTMSEPELVFPVGRTSTRRVPEETPMNEVPVP